MKTTKTALPKAQKGCGYGKAQRVNARRKFWNSDAGKAVKKVGIGLGTAGAAVGAYAKNAFGVKDKVKDLMGQQKGGPVKTLPKKQNGGTGMTRPMPSPRPKTYPTGNRGIKGTPRPQIGGKGNEGFKPYTGPRKPSMSSADYKAKAISRYGSEENARSAKAIQKKGGATKSLVRKQKGGATFRDIDYYGEGIVKSQPRKIGKGTKETESRYLYGYAGPSGAEVIKRKYNKEGALVKTKSKRTTPEKVDKYIAENEDKIEYKRGGATKKKTVAARKK
jgi:hypothetical protein